jgi:hypothetical protein
MMAKLRLRNGYSQTQHDNIVSQELANSGWGKETSFVSTYMNKSHTSSIEHT